MRSSASISRTTRSESSDCRTMVSSSSAIGLRIAQRDRVLVQHFEQRGHRIQLGRERLHRRRPPRRTTPAAAASAPGSSPAPRARARSRSGLAQLLFERGDLLLDLGGTAGRRHLLVALQAPASGSGSRRGCYRACRAAPTGRPARCRSGSGSWPRSSGTAARSPRSAWRERGSNDAISAGPVVGCLCARAPARRLRDEAAKRARIEDWQQDQSRSRARAGAAAG